jgi:hypothetical protein
MRLMSAGRPHITVRICRSPEEEAAADTEFWRALSPAERIEETWRLSEELWRLRGEFNDEPGLCRSVARAFADAEVRFLVVGAYALALHAKPGATSDLDLWVEPTRENAERVFSALKRFGAPLAELTEADFTTPELVFQIGVPPRRIDILTELTGLSFSEAWNDRMLYELGPARVYFIGKRSLVKNKRALGRPKDLADLQLLGSPEAE